MPVTPTPFWLAAAPAVPAPPWLVVFLHGLTFVLHFAAMNVLVASAFHLAVARGGSDAMVELRRRMAAALPPAFSLTITLGVAPLLFIQLIHGERFYSSSIHMAWPWLGILGVLVLAYYAAYAIDGRLKRGADAPVWLRAAPFAGLVLFSFVMAANVSLSERPDVMETLGEPGWNLALLETKLVWRWGHELIGAVALGSLWLLWLGQRLATKDEDVGARVTKRGAMVAMILTAAGMVFGTIQLAVAPRDVAGAVGGASLGLGIVAGLGAIAVAATMIRKPSMKKAYLAMGLGVATLAFKTALRFAVRDNRLEKAGGVEAPVYDTDWGPVALFAVCLVLAVAALLWLVRVMASAKPVTGES